MSRITEYDRRIKQYASAVETVSALEDINAIRMQAIRRRFEKNRAFFDEIRALYGIVRASAVHEASNAARAERVLYVAMTANQRFAGTLAHDIVDALVRELTAHPNASCLVVGRLGWQHLEASGLASRARQVLFGSEAPTHEEFVALLSHASRFDRVFVLHGRFVNAFRQEVAMQDITQSPSPAEGVPEPYLFEPEITAILSFFDAQVRYVLFERVLLESELARAAARFMKMEESREQASELLDTERLHRIREMAAVGNATLLETFTGYARWHDDGHD